MIARHNLPLRVYTFHHTYYPVGLDEEPEAQIMKQRSALHIAQE